VFVAVISADVAFAAPPDSMDAARAAAIIQPYVNDHLFSGTVLIAKDGKPVFAQGYGQGCSTLDTDSLKQQGLTI
jgi:CubicO group peptidase (beta-lactamase class C family)